LEDAVGSFVQIIEFTTSRFDELRALQGELESLREGGTATRGTLCADRDRPSTYLNVVEFASYESAMENSNRPETAQFAAKMMELCDGPPVFRNLEVLETWIPEG
jgi:hypothetical protein